MQVHKTSLLDHVKLLRAAATAAGAEVLLPGDSLAAFLRFGGSHTLLHPRSVVGRGRGTFLASGLPPEATGFAGWLPYPVRQWPAATDRLHFKEVLATAGLIVPEAYVDPAAAPAGVLVKSAARSQEHPMRGPFRTAAEAPLDPERREFYEAHLAGDRLTVWCLEDVPICAELERAPFVIGNGASSILDLVLERASFSGPRTAEEGEALLEHARATLAYQGLEDRAVPERGARVIVDFQHGGALSHPSDLQVVRIEGGAERPWVAILEQAAQAVHASIPEDLRAESLFTLEAILGEDHNLWFLGASSHPIVHPLVYPALVKRLAVRVANEGRSVTHLEQPRTP